MVSNHLLRQYTLKRGLKLDQNLQRRLGIQPISPTETRGPHSQIAVSEPVALNIMHTLGLDPFEIGI
jgi:hypothetical protein